MTPRPLCSVIVPCYRDWPRAAACLQCLSQQTLPRDQFEIILINNDPNDPAPPDFHLALADHILADHILDCATPGSYAARNAGLAIAKGNYLCFIDADCLPRPDWLAQLLAAFDAGAARVAGRVEVFHQTIPPNSVELYEGLTAFPQDVYAAYGWAATANMAARADVFLAVGPFAANLRSGGDKEWGQRAAAAGVPIVYCADAVVAHPSRPRFADLAQKARRVEGGLVQRRLQRRSRAASLIAFLPTLPFRLLPVSGRVISYLCRPSLTLRQRIRVAMVYQRLSWVRTIERARILLGGTPLR